MTYRAPPRLKHGEEFGALLRSAESVDVTAARLAENAAGYKALIAAGATTALWKLLVPLGLVLALIPVAYVATRAPSPTPSVVEAPAHAIAGEQPATHASIVTHESIDGLPVAEQPRPAPVAVERPAPLVTSIEAPPSVPAPSALPEQLRLYEEAREAARRGDYTTGVARVDELLSRFPSTPMRAEAELARADFLARANRVTEAARALEALIADRSHAGRRGELLRTLGDLYRRTGDCKRALEVYDRALAGTLRDRDRKDVEAGRERCKAR